MSTLAYGALTRKREEAEADTSITTSPPGLSPYVDALAALVPGEVLAAQAAILSLTTTTEGTGDEAKTTIVDSTAMVWSFWALLGISVFLYVVAHFPRRFDRWDLIRVLIPPAAFAGWTMITHPSLFDAVFDWSTTSRNVIAILGALVVGAVATGLSYTADAAEAAAAPAAAPAVPAVP